MRKLTPSEFPSLLAEIPDPPKELWLEGALPDQEKYRLLTVVGSRRYSSYGREVCETLIEGLRGYPVAVVSGLAIGIDSLAHQAALSAELPTIAVPGSGLNPDVLYPRQNLRLAEEILDSGGALLSEFPPDFRATNYSFPQRNRIMAGMSHATLLIEAQEKSGTLITARLASDYNRELLVVPGSIFSPNSAGTHQFLKLGATPVTESADILRALGFNLLEAQPPEERDDLTDAERAVLEIIAIEPLPRDELIRALEISVSEANTLLAVMELKGLIKESLGEIRSA